MKLRRVLLLAVVAGAMMVTSAQPASAGLLNQLGVGTLIRSLPVAPIPVVGALLPIAPPITCGEQTTGISHSTTTFDGCIGTGGQPIGCTREQGGGYGTYDHLFCGIGGFNDPAPIGVGAANNANLVGPSSSTLLIAAGSISYLESDVDGIPSAGIPPSHVWTLKAGTLTYQCIDNACNLVTS